MSTTGTANLTDLPVLASYGSWRGFVLHSLVIVAAYRCAVCDRSRDSAMVATQESSDEVICPKCFIHLARTEHGSGTARADPARAVAVLEPQGGISSAGQTHPRSWPPATVAVQNRIETRSWPLHGCGHATHVPMGRSSSETGISGVGRAVGWVVLDPIRRETSLLDVDGGITPGP